MLNCNITEKLYGHIKKEQFGICSNTDTLISMALSQLRYDLGCGGVVICYTEEECEESVITCSLTSTQNIESISCGLTATQN